MRDRSGIVQLVFNEQYSKKNFERASELKPEYVVRVQGEIRKRENPNPNIPTGNLEVWVDDFKILNTAKTPPIGIIKHGDVSEEIRLRYRYLDLRRSQMKNNIIMRHKVIASIHNYLNHCGYLNIDTPFLTKSTPEGARDFLVPSRLNRGRFYALPQSPQIFKQLLMVSGFERYYQVVKCFRDEDLRADRQPEFTQIDIEASFIDAESIYTLVDGMFEEVLKECYGKTVQVPIRRMQYDSAMEMYGTDKPDLRVDLKIKNLDSLVEQDPKDFILKGLMEGKHLFGLILPQSDKITRKILENYAAVSRSEGVDIFTWMRIANRTASGPMAKLFKGDILEWIRQFTDKDSVIVLAALGLKKQVLSYLGKTRSELGKMLELLDENTLKFCWVTDFPLFEWSEEEGKIVSVHHPFTSPHGIESEDTKALLDNMRRDPFKVKSRSYDFVLNGIELGGGSIRIHKSEIQKQVFSILGLGQEEMKHKFGFLLEALDYGSPPHGGIALGLDRIVMMLQGEESIRDVIPFPKTTSGTCPMSGAPDIVSAQQLAELGLRKV